MCSNIKGETYEDDSKILNYLFGYKIGQDGKIGFPETALKEVNDIDKLDKLLGVIENELSKG